MPTCLTMSSSKLIPYLEVLFAVVVWGASFIATKIVLRDVEPITLVWLRFTIGLVVLAIPVFWRKQFGWPAREDWLYLGLLGFLGITFHQWLQSNGLQTSEASTTAWIVATSPVFMALLGWLLLKESLTLWKSLGIALAALGVLTVVSHGDLRSMSIGRLGAPGDVLILFSSLNWAVFSALSRRGLKRYSASLMIFQVMCFGWLFTSLLFLSGRHFPEIALLSRSGWLGVAFLGIFCSGLAYIAWYDALQALTTAEAGVFLYIEPLVAVVVALIVLQEQITLASLFGGLIILLGVWLVNRN